MRVNATAKPIQTTTTRGESGVELYQIIPDTVIMKYQRHYKTVTTGSVPWVVVGNSNEEVYAGRYLLNYIHNVGTYHGEAENPLSLEAYGKAYPRADPFNGYGDMNFTANKISDLATSIKGVVYEIKDSGYPFIAYGSIFVVSEGEIRIYPLKPPGDEPVEYSDYLNWWWFSGEPEPIRTHKFNYPGKVIGADVLSDVNRPIILVSTESESYLIDVSMTTDEVRLVKKIDGESKIFVSLGMQYLIVYTDGTNYYVEDILYNPTYGQVSELWQYTTASMVGKPVYSYDPTTNSSYIYFEEWDASTGLGSITVLNAITGSKLTSIALGTTQNGPLPSSGVGLDDGTAVMFNPNAMFRVNSSGSILWTVQLNSATVHSPNPIGLPFDNGYIYAIVNGNLSKIDAYTGSVVSIASTGINSGTIDIMMYGDDVITLAGDMYIYDKNTGELKKHIPYVSPAPYLYATAQYLDIVYQANHSFTYPTAYVDNGIILAVSGKDGESVVVIG